MNAAVDDVRHPRQAQTQKTQTWQAQQEADTLEQDRLKAEQLGKRSRVMQPPHSRDTPFGNAVDNAAPVQPGPGKHRKANNPYFTAKDNTPKPAKAKAEKKGANPKAAP